MSEKRDIFTHHPGGDESGFFEKEASQSDSKGRRGRGTCHDRGENGCQVCCFLFFLREKKGEERDMKHGYGERVGKIGRKDEEKQN